MRSLVVSAAAFAFAGAVAAQPAAAQPPVGPPAAPPKPPRLFAQAGYAEPAIPASACRAVSAEQATCTMPAMTAGRYFARAAVTSTATADGAAQQVTLVAGDQHCTATWSPDPKSPWAVGAKRTFYAGCVFAIVTDEPLTVTAVYRDEKATKDPAGPTLTLYPQAWSGALNALPVAIKQ
jgi:hypothetical protein